MNKKALASSGSIWGFVILLAVTTAGAAPSAYFQAVTNLNPVGYWPMHEVKAAAPGDIETNYGTLGLLGTGYYPDWVGGNTNEITHQVAGALSGDSDTAAYFAGASTTSSTNTLSALYVPHTSPLTTLNPPFSVECWFYPISYTNAGDIWSQNGDEGLNAGATGANAGAVRGIRFSWDGAASAGEFNVYSYYNNNTLHTFEGATNLPANQWYHVVVTCDAGTNMTIYTNGTSYTNFSAAGSYQPDYWTPFELAAGRGNTRLLGGATVDEVAIYTNVLSDVGTHYNDGISGGAGAYFHDVTNDHPAVYLRMDAPAYTAPAVGTWPVLTNYGTVAGNGVYTPGTMPGIVAGPALPNGVSFKGLAGTNVAQFSGVSSFADAGYATAYDPTGAVPFSVTAMFRGNPCDGRNNTIAGHSDNSWNLYLNTSGKLVFYLGTNSASAATSAGTYNDGNWHQVVAVYTPASVPTVPGTNAIYVDGVLDTSLTTVSTNGIAPGSPFDVMLASDPQYTNAPTSPGLGRQFAGQVCEVALFTNALTVANVQTLYNSSGIVPTISVQPLTGRVVNGGAGTYINFSVTANGSGALAYQWYFNTSSNYSGATRLTDGTKYTNSTTSNVTVTNLANADNGYFFAVITNNYGSVTSILASLTVNVSPTINSQLPVPYTNLFTLFIGVSPTFSVSASGASPIHYYWFTNGVVVGGATNFSFTLTNVQASFSNYCIVSNSLGWVTGSVWAASVIAAPTAPYPTNVLAAHPIGYWRLNEGPDDGNGNQGVLCHDYVGGNDGIYTNVYLANSDGGTGYSPSTDPAVTSVQFGQFGMFLPIVNNDAGQIQGIDLAATNGANGEFSIEAWVNNLPVAQVIGAPIAAKGEYGIDDQFNLGIDASKTHYRFYVRDASGIVHTTGSSPALDGNWHHLVGVCDETNGQLSLYFDGKLVNTAAIPTNSGVYEDPEAMTIGAGASDGVNYTNQFEGYINDVAVYNYALSIGQIQSQYSPAGGGISPYFTQSAPSNAIVNAGAVLTVPAMAAGSTPVGYYWTDVNAGTNVAATVTMAPPLNATLTVNNTPGSWNKDQLELTVTNAYGSTNAYVTLTVYTNVLITQDLPPNVILVPGKSYTYSIGVVGPTPYAYQWYNVVTPIANQTNSTYTLTAGSPGSTTYYVVITNIFGATTSSVSTFTSVAQLSNPYATSILQLNPVAYWPMHEVEAAAPGDIETNYGSLGLLGTGYYGDWTTTNIVRSAPGALAGDGDSAVYFPFSGPVLGGGPTNCLLIPHTSPLLTLNPPFSVECWFSMSNAQSGDLWCESGDVGLNSGLEGSSIGSVDGVQLYWNPGVRVYVNDNNTTQNGLGLVQGIYNVVGQWLYVAITCDANTNISYYVDGNLLITNKAAVGLYSPDYWSPVTIGSGFGFKRAIDASVDDFAIYTNVITDIAQHYNAGTNSSPSPTYFQLVTNDNPLVYLRMDSPTYTTPPIGTWPVLLNYGNAGASGVYTPGTMPGVVPGPNSNGVPFSGLSGTNVAQLSGVSSFADAGYAPVYNPVGAVPFSVTAMFRGNPCDGRVQTIVGHSDNSWRINMNTNGTLQCQLGTNAASLVNSAIVYNDGKWHQVVDVYTPATNPSLTGTNSLYVDGVLDTTVTGISTSGVGPGTNLDVLIGSDPQYTNNPAGVGRQFAGQICEVALFTNALTAAQVQQMYSLTIPVTVNQNPTNIMFSLTGNQLTLSWPADHTGWRLQAQTNALNVGISTNWHDVSGSTGVDNEIITINPNNPTVFYRLIYP